MMTFCCLRFKKLIIQFQLLSSIGGILICTILLYYFCTFIGQKFSHAICGTNDKCFREPFFNGLAICTGVVLIIGFNCPLAFLYMLLFSCTRKSNHDCSQQWFYLDSIVFDQNLNSTQGETELYQHTFVPVNEFIRILVSYQSYLHILVDIQWLFTSWTDRYGMWCSID